VYLYETKLKLKARFLIRTLFNFIQNPKKETEKFKKDSPPKGESFFAPNPAALLLIFAT
jgi:hypothetical protein